MVLQRDQPLVISGTANAGDKVEVKFSNKVQGTATADCWGKWRVELPAQPAGGPYTLTIKRVLKTLKDSKDLKDLKDPKDTVYSIDGKILPTDSVHGIVITGGKKIAVK